MVEVEICLWKRQMENRRSTAGIDLRKNPTLLCGKCPGTEEGANAISCDKFFTKGTVLTTATTEKPKSLSNFKASETAKA